VNGYTSANGGGYKQCELWTVEQLKEFLRDQNISLAGNKAELVKKICDIIATDDLERDLEALPFQTVDYPVPPSFNDLSAATDWGYLRFPSYLRNKSYSLLES